MFVGHYAVGLAAKALDDRIPLWTLFIAAQLPDILWAGFVLLGVEQIQILPGPTVGSPLDLRYVPFSHSLVATAIWGVVAVMGYNSFVQYRRVEGAALLVGATVLAHWFLDVLVHRPDLPLYDNAAKMGLGLWNYPVPAFLIEAGLFLGALGLYLRATRPLSRRGRYGMVVLGLLLLGAHASGSFGPSPPSPAAVAATGLSLYVVIAGLVWWLERGRTGQRLGAAAAGRSGRPGSGAGGA